MRPLLGLLTDFGLADHYVGVIKAVILGICPEANLVDISHEIPPQSVVSAGYCLEQSVSSFPPGSIFMCVVDPGVGSSRRAVAVEAGGYFFVAPDNGLLGRALERLPEPSAMVELELPEGASNTFHGRDLFAPAAAKLAAGTGLSMLGRPCDGLLKTARHLAIREEDSLELAVLTTDHFGNIIFDFERREGWERLQPGNTFALEASGIEPVQVSFETAYYRVESDQGLLLWNASNYLELALREGSAASRWELGCGARVKLQFQQE